MWLKRPILLQKQLGGKRNGMEHTEKGRKAEDSPGSRKQGQEVSGGRQSEVGLTLTGFPGFLGNFECYFMSCRKVTEPRAGRAWNRWKKYANHVVLVISVINHNRQTGLAINSTILQAVVQP